MQSNQEIDRRQIKLMKRLRLFRVYACVGGYLERRITSGSEDTRPKQSVCFQDSSRSDADEKA